MILFSIINKCSKETPMLILLKIDLSGELDGTTSSLDLLLSERRDVLCLNNHGLSGGELALAEHLEVTKLGHIHHGGRGGASVLVNILGDEAPKSVDVNCGHVQKSTLLVVPLHTNLTEITRVKLVHKNSVMVLATSVTTSAGVASVLADTAVSGTLVSSLLSIVVETGRHLAIITSSIEEKVSNGT